MSKKQGGFAVAPTRRICREASPDRFRRFVLLRAALLEYGNQIRTVMLPTCFLFSANFIVNLIIGSFDGVVVTY